MRSHEIDYQIKGHDIQFVEIELDPGETVIAEAGSMFYMEEGIAFETKLGDGSEASSGIMGKLLGAAMRGITGETIFLTLRGTGRVWLLSMPIRKLIRQPAPAGDNSRKGSSSLLGNFLEG